MAIQVDIKTKKSGDEPSVQYARPDSPGDHSLSGSYVASGDSTRERNKKHKSKKNNKTASSSSGHNKGAINMLKPFKGGHPEIDKRTGNPYKELKGYILMKEDQEEQNRIQWE